MYAVIRTGGKQYRVAKDQILRVEKLDAAAGDSVTFDEVLMVGGDQPAVGAPLVEGATVTATVLDQARADKIIVFRRKRRKDHRRTLGHRQYQTVVRITDIVASGGAAPDGTTAAASATEETS